jgi:hypothetical protein
MRAGRRQGTAGWMFRRDLVSNPQSQIRNRRIGFVFPRLSTGPIHHNSFLAKDLLFPSVSGQLGLFRTIGIGLEWWNNRIVECWVFHRPTLRHRLGAPLGAIGFVCTVACQLPPTAYSLTIYFHHKKTFLDARMLCKNRKSRRNSLARIGDARRAKGCNSRRAVGSSPVSLHGTRCGAWRENERGMFGGV